MGTDEDGKLKEDKEMRKFWMENWLSTIIGAIVVITIGVMAWTWNNHVGNMDRRFSEQNEKFKAQHEALISEIETRKEEDKLLEAKIKEKLDTREYLKDLGEAQEFRKEMRADIKELLKRKS